MAEKYAINNYENNVDFVPEYVEGDYEIPLLYPEDYEHVEWVSFKDARTMNKCKPYGIHFYLSDYQFQNIWTQRERYTHMFRRFGAVMTPDFSIYTDWPRMVQIWNHYRKHLLGSWMQSIGCKVYPTIAWGDEDSYDFCFSGEPRNSTVCVSSVGTQKNPESRRLFLSGYEKMMEVLQPETILFYGNIPKECTGNIIYIEPFNDKLKEMKRNGRTGYA